MAIRREPGSSAIPAELLRLLEQLRPSAVIVGIPLSMDGTEGDMAREVRAFAARLEASSGIPVEEWDERLSTARAERTLREMELPRRRRQEKGRSDMMAAALMLSDFLRSGRAEDLARRAAGRPQADEAQPAEPRSARPQRRELEAEGRHDEGHERDSEDAKRRAGGLDEGDGDVEERDGGARGA